jgi:hypothetical protein
MRVVQFRLVRVLHFLVPDDAAEIQIDDERGAAARALDFDLGFQPRRRNMYYELLAEAS